MKREYACDLNKYYMSFDDCCQDHTIKKYWGRLAEMITGP